MGFFDAAYDQTPPWETGRPQRAIRELADAGGIRGAVLDVGCGTGENALMLAARGHEVVGIDIAPAAIAKAEAKAKERGVQATFLVEDGLTLGVLGRTFDTVLDSGLFHVFPPEDRPRYVASLEQVTRPGTRYHMLVWSDREPPGVGPYRVSERDIRDAFDTRRWAIRRILPTVYETLIHEGPGAQAWLATVERR
jgi:SAM-dependent methyltransferase